MYKVSIKTLQDIKKQLEVNNIVLAKQKQTPEIAKMIKANQKQIKLLVDNYYI